jgi:hypothetical protein
MYGFESMALNNLFNKIFDADGEKTSVDYSSLSPYDVQGWFKLYQAAMSGGLTKMVANSPAGQLFLKEGGRMRNAMVTMEKYFCWLRG